MTIDTKNLRVLAEAATPSKRVIEMSGQKFGKLTVTWQHGFSQNGEAQWDCVCECGNEAVVTGSALRKGRTQSCGCQRALAVRMNGRRNATHGHTKAGVPISRTYNTWKSMLSRCEYKRSTSYKYYGAKGVTVCERWKSFQNFLDDMGERPEGMSLDRKDSLLGYSPENCKWSTDLEQQNNKSSNILIEAFGKTQTIAQWSRETGIHKATIGRRFFAGKSPEFAVSGASRNKKKKVKK